MYHDAASPTALRRSREENLVSCNGFKIVFVTCSKFLKKKNLPPYRDFQIVQKIVKIAGPDPPYIPRVDPKNVPGRWADETVSSA